MKHLIRWLLSLLYPPKCIFCRRLLKETELDYCTSCRRTLPEVFGDLPHGEFYTNRYAALAYREQVRESIHRYKFSGMECYAPAYARLLAMRLLREDLNVDFITWVPVSKQRKRKRGYDQSYLLAAAVADELGYPCIRTLKKVKDNPPQSSQKDAAQRKANVLNVYEAADGQMLLGKRILLIDDVITTGATLSEASRVLLTAGAAQVDVAAFAAANRSDSKVKR